MSNAMVLFMTSLLAALHGADKPNASLVEAPAAEIAAETPIDAPTWPITFYFENRQEALPVVLFTFDLGLGAAFGLSRDALALLSHHVRCFRTDRERPMHPRLAEIVARVTEAFGRQNVDVISGFRAPPFGAAHSKHFLGRAMDLRLPGIPSRKLAAWVWKNFRGVGVGVYPKQDFVHIDVRDVDVRWLDTSLHGESAHARYFPRLPSDRLPVGAPVLSYDQPRSAPAYAQRPAPVTTALAMVAGIRGAE